MPKTRSIPAWPLLMGVLALSSCKPAANGLTEGANAPRPLYTLCKTYEELAPLLENNSDTLYVVNFWATWCAPCVAELPSFESLYQNTRGKKIRIILVSLDFQSDIVTNLEPFLKERRLGPEVFMLADNRYDYWINKVSQDWSGAIPATLLLKNGKKQFIEDSFPNYADLEALVQKYL